jgi:hypothetical protein
MLRKTFWATKLQGVQDENNKGDGKDGFKSFSAESG